MYNIPITSRIQKKTKGGMVKEPMLNMGSPLAQKQTAKKQTALTAIENSGSAKKDEKSDGTSDKEPRIDYNSSKSKTNFEVRDGKVISTTTNKSVEPDKTIAGKPKKETILYSDLDPNIVEQARKDNMDTYGTHNPTKEGLTDNTRETGEFEPDTIIPGDVTEGKTTAEHKVALKGTAKNPWQSRFNSRNVKKTTKDVTTSQRKLDNVNRKLGKMDPEDKVKGEKRFDRLDRKLNQQISRNKAFKGAAKAALAQSEQGKVAGDKVFLGERDAITSDAVNDMPTQSKMKTTKTPKEKKDSAGTSKLLKQAENDFLQMRSGFKMKGYNKRHE